ncbi:hypothetical protein WOLCODRAFT_157374 [Wolfiporia cocos MD-104 SS10]|uniref:Uncharacterized protein n=1 Tax=Wolfiporia cocos (strain MD-104) TaxID=742152 RepID=A0A2H3J4T1_WOLCO|nr:hypothetical protein WOLCODRAFT_157374 [Wolfiporia cocos MD-104 SS10]
MSPSLHSASTESLSDTNSPLLTVPQPGPVPAEASAVKANAGVPQRVSWDARQGTDMRKTRAAVPRADSGGLGEILRKMQALSNDEEEKLRNARASIDAAERRRRRMRTELAELQRAWEEESHRSEQITREYERAYADWNDKQQKMAALLETKSAELRSAQTYLTMVDNVSDMDLLRMVRELNSHIFQFTAQLANNLPYSHSPSRQNTLPADLTLTVKQSVGPDILHLLLARSHSEDPICVQIALQSGMISFARSVIMTWSLETDIANGQLQSIYNWLRSKEDPAVSGRWRALTNATLRSLTQTETIKLRLKDDLAKVVSNIISVSGINKALPLEEIYKNIRTQYGDKLAEIIDFIVSLHRTIGEDVISHDIELVHIQGGQPFDAKHMEDAYPIDCLKAPRASDARPLGVFGTVEIGVRRVERSGGEYVDSDDTAHPQFTHHSPTHTPSELSAEDYSINYGTPAERAMFPQYFGPDGRRITPPTLSPVSQSPTPSAPPLPSPVATPLLRVVYPFVILESQV